MAYDTLNQVIHALDSRPEEDGQPLILTSVIILSEYIRPDGMAVLLTDAVDASGHYLPDWRREGLLYNALSAWPEAMTTDDDDEDTDD